MFAHMRAVVVAELFQNNGGGEGGGGTSHKALPALAAGQPLLWPCSMAVQPRHMVPMLQRRHALPPCGWVFPQIACMNSRFGHL